LLVRVDDDAAEGVLQLGLQECSGTAWLANVTLTVGAEKPARPPHMRGVVGPSAYAPKDFDELAGWKVNLIRWQLINPAWPRTEVPSDPRSTARGSTPNSTNSPSCSITRSASASA